MKVNFEELKNLNYDSGKKMLLSLGYIDGGPGISDGIYFDYIHDQYFILYDDEGEEIDTVSWTSWENGQDGEDSEAEIIKEGWTK